jgi:hypothetical protein
VAGRIQRPNHAGVVDDKEAGGEAGDDLFAEAFGGFGARFHGALLQAQIAQRIFHRRRHQRRLPAIERTPLGHLARGDDELDQRIGQHRGERGDNRRQAEEEEAGLVHGSGARGSGFGAR